ncbi:Mov34/MPN/PAD-1 family protein [Brevundimonas naejangsanensis]
MAKVDAPYRVGVELAIRALTAHPQAQLVGGPVFDDAGACVEVAFDLDFGARWLAATASPTGVYPVEVVEIRFPRSFPRYPVQVSLRPDFSRNHPHIQPGLTTSGRVIPCLVEGRLGEFVASNGFEGLAVQIHAWLVSAAEGRLIDAGSGWEPARRDEITDVISADEDSLRKLVDLKGGFRFFSTEYLCEWDSIGVGARFWGDLGPPTSVKTTVDERGLRGLSPYARGKGLAIAVWPGRGPDGSPVTSDVYLPDDVHNVEALWERARAYGVDGPLRDAVSMITPQVAKRKHGDTPLVILMLARRPRALVGYDSPIEILGYLVPCHHPGGAMSVTTDTVRPVGLLGALSAPMLQRTSGAPKSPKWVMLGAGSLGSKFALHMGRQASPPALVADRSSFSPHNAARHGLYPTDQDLDWVGPKAEGLVRTLKALKGEPTALVGDHLAFADALKGMRGNSRPTWFVNTTASIVARETLAGLAFDKLPQQVEMSLYRLGRTGVMAVEGENRNPNTLELTYGLYQRAADDADLRDQILAEDGASRLQTGQGCGSLTVVMTDARISAHAAIFAEAFTALVPPPEGEVRLFERSEDLGVNVRSFAVRPFLRIPVTGMEGWTVSLAPDVRTAIEAETAEYPNTETGGVLIGRASALARTIVVTALEPAPPDSLRRPDRFVLGTEGLALAIRGREEESKGLLTVVGTWHSHLGTARPSEMDHASASVVGAGASHAMAFVIIGSDGYRAIAAVPKGDGKA